ncbi:MAG TPA: hypothetical protein PK191_11035 [Niabella sp.]|mgnify:CR=1 FL=1|nr:hypothetical protein [Niabella sp.]HOZ97477.1 hypothetical protein [Niabella sp.]HQW15565.1 hypothetical protein [Niabella sp.]HQX20708.1 hypothetical protein [Niabella sp.]HQX40938.1 hypothetical protein [Niabella sp.]
MASILPRSVHSPDYMASYLLLAVEKAEKQKCDTPNLIRAIGTNRWDAICTAVQGSDTIAMPSILKPASLIKNGLYTNESFENT